MSSWTNLQHEQHERLRRERAELAVRELEDLSRRLVETYVTDVWEQNKFLNEIGKITHNGLR